MGRPGTPALALSMALAAATGACTVSTDYGGTEYRCDDGICPAGFTCVAGRCEPPVDIDAQVLDAPEADAAAVDAPVAIDAAAPDAAGSMFDPPWWDPAYPHRVAMIVVNNASIEMPAGYQAGFLFDINALPGFDAVGDTDNMHVARWDGASWTDVNRIIDDTALSEEWIWIRLPDAVAPGATDATHWMYWGNLTPTTAPASSSTVFDFYEGFSSGTSPDGDWLSNGAPSLAGSEVTLDNGEDIRSVVGYGVGSAVDFTMTVPTWLPRFWGGFQVADTFAQDQPWIVFISRDSTEIWPEVRIDAAGIAPEWQGMRRPFDAGSQYFYYIDRFADRAVFHYDGEGIAEESPTFTTPFTGSLDLRFTNDGAPGMQIGMTRVRKTVYPLPTTSLGTMESLP